MILPASDRKLRLFETVLVLTVAFGGSLLFSLYAAFSGAAVEAEAPLGGIARPLYGIMGQVTALALLAYVLYRRGSNLAAVGLSFSWKDVPQSIALAVAAHVAYWLWAYLLHYGGSHAGIHPRPGGPHNMGFLLASPDTAATVLLLLYVLVNPIKEELLIRAFLISEVRWLSGRTALAVLVSVGVQCCYHFYQGAFYALSYAALFLVFSLYYVRTGRIFPVILAHLYFDLAAVLR